MGIILTVHNAAGSEIFVDTCSSANEAAEALARIMVQHDKCSATLEPEDDLPDGETMAEAMQWTMREGRTLDLIMKITREFIVIAITAKDHGT